MFIILEDHIDIHQPKEQKKKSNYKYTGEQEEIIRQRHTTIKQSNSEQSTQNLYLISYS